MNDQLVGLAVAVFTCINLVLSGRAAHGVAVTGRAMKRLASVIGSHPGDRVVDTSLIDEVQALTAEQAVFRDQYKRDQDNMLTQLWKLQTGNPDDQSPVRQGRTHTVEARRH